VFFQVTEKIFKTAATQFITPLVFFRTLDSSSVYSQDLDSGNQPCDLPAVWFCISGTMSE
jgi:hypothetical protein